MTYALAILVISFSVVILLNGFIFALIIYRRYAEPAKRDEFVAAIETLKTDLAKKQTENERKLGRLASRVYPQGEFE